MKLTLKSVLCFGFIMTMAGNILADCSGASCTSTDSCSGYACARPDFLPFSQSENRTRDYVGQGNLQNVADMDDWNHVCSLAYEYERNWNKDKLGRYFGPNCTNNKITIGTNAGAGIDMRGEDIGLSPTFEGTLTLNPKIENHIIEPSLYLGLDRWLEGLYLWTKLPITHTIWTMETCETSSARGYYYFTANLMDTAVVASTTASAYEDVPTIHGGTEPYSSLNPRTLSSICQAFSGKYTFGHKDIPLQAGRILCNCPQYTTGIADIPLHLGYNFFNKDRGYIGLYAKGVFPTGKVKRNASIFDPRIGYKRWQAGGGLQGRIKLYENDEGSTTFQTYLDVNVTHVFKGRECRLFDMKANGSYRPTDIKFSRYLLMKQFSEESWLYTGRLRNFADVFTVCTKSGFDWLLDGLLYFEFKRNNWSMDLGYEIKGRDCEKFGKLNTQCNMCTYDDCDDCSATTSSLYRYGIKGIKAVSNTTIEPTASIKLGQTGSGTSASAANVAYTLNPDTISTEVDLNSGRRPEAFSHKIFTDIGYTWDTGEFSHYDNHGPIFMNIGGSVEFAHDNRALYNWSVFGKWGCAYN